MTTRSLKLQIATAVDDLLSLRSTSPQHSTALAQLEQLVALFALDPSHPLLDAFLLLQDSLSRNVTAALLEWLGRTLARQEVGQEHAQETWENLARALRLFQGLLLLHRPSQRLFARRCSLEYLLAVLDMTRPSHPFSPALSSPKPFPSPVIFPSSPSFPSPNLSDREGVQPPPVATTTAATQLALATLDTLLCALVDRPKTMRTFEELGGLDAAVKILKDKSASQVVRIKVIELLYFYLLPESAADSSTYSGSPDSSFSSAASTISSHFSGTAPPDLPTLLATAADFIPQTPVKARPRSYVAPTSSASATPRRVPDSSSSREPSPSRTPRRNGHSRSQSLQDFATPLSTPSSASSARPTPTPSRPLSASARPSTSSSSTSVGLSRSSRPLSSSRREPTISESDTDGETSSAHSSAAEESSGGGGRTPRTAASRRLSGLLSSAAAALDSATIRRGHRRTQSAASASASTASTPSSSRERSSAGAAAGERAARRLSSSNGLPLPPPSPRYSTGAAAGKGGTDEQTPRPTRTRLPRGSSDAEEMPPPPLPPPRTSSAASSSSSRPSSHARSRSLATIPPSPRTSSLPSSSTTSSAGPAAPPPPPTPPKPSPSPRLEPVHPLSPRTPRTATRPPRDPQPHSHTRTEQEKKDLLRRVMPNVDALEERFKAMGLGIGEA
ncbi:hypothetical protein JCM6882_009505 [Rhodosporidiobolus microsporus]